MNTKELLKRLDFRPGPGLNAAAAKNLRRVNNLLKEGKIEDRKAYRRLT